MGLEFASPLNETPGVIASLLKRSYAALVASEPSLWRGEQVRWEQYDREVFQQPETVGASVFLTRLDGSIVGFASWDPRQRPQRGIVGHNCILPEFRGRGFGREQIREVLRRFENMGIQTALVTTCDHPFFVPARRMYQACGFHEVRRVPWDRDPGRKIIEYERQVDRQDLG
ncbi:MAG: GNAT family N-acetyltransferase [Phycisphaerales bacterium]